MTDDDALLNDAPTRRPDLAAPTTGAAPADLTPPSPGGTLTDPRLRPGRSWTAGQRRAMAGAGLLLLAVVGWFAVRALLAGRSMHRW